MKIEAMKTAVSLVELMLAVFKSVAIACMLALAKKMV